ncbi:hypothetical protein [Alicyclobacillus macrosporangiidus]|uniref:hypothetical protein n=1 Tax=Alicyclobacillus macrosporangiidus TaxID=392015 RepID=UPI0011133BDB|nr:hypothetical protein [Alicyclobacillus macrosporangiidus]
MAMVQNVAIAPEFGGGKLILEQFDHHGQGQWNTRHLQEDKIIPGGISYKLDDQHLLLRSSAVGFETPVMYTFTSQGVHPSSVSQEFPTAGEVPNSVTRTLQVIGTTKGGATDFHITGDLSPLHMRVGQHLVIGRLRLRAKASVGISPVQRPR